MMLAFQMKYPFFTVPALKGWLRKILLGNPLASSMALAHRLPIWLALPVFASDNISSSAYCNQEILIVLAGVSLAGGGSALGLQIWITLAIALVMVIVVTSYRRAVFLYPTSGGSYTVTKSNLGPFAGLVAGAALLIDYIMTVAVSVSSGVDALTSAYPMLLSEKVLIAVLLVSVLMLVNLRGSLESGWIFALPMYLFVLMMGSMIVTMLAHVVLGGGHVPSMGIDPHLPPHLRLPGDIILPRPGAMLGLFLLLRAFANGSSAMTGTEAVSNGVSAFKPPEAKNAATTLVIMACILLFLMLGIGFAAHIYHVVPSKTETIVSMVTRATFGYSVPYYLTQLFTLAILMVAANTSFADFPRLLAFVARDGFAPKAFSVLGDRLVFHRGINTLTIISVAVIIAFKADVTALIGLYSIGVFLCFTLSQLGMAKKLGAMRERGWRGGVILNLVGACVTGLVAVVVAVSKFTEGAWMVLVLIPIIITVCYAIKRHYEWFENTMTLHSHDYNPLTEPSEPLTVLVLVSSDIHRGILEGLECGRAIAAGNDQSLLRAVHVEIDTDKTERLRVRWAQFVEPYLGHAITLEIIPSPYRWLSEPVLDYLNSIDHLRDNDRIVVVLPEFETGNPLTHFLHNFTAKRLRDALLNRPNITVVSSRFFMKPMAWRLGRGGLVY